MATTLYQRLKSIYQNRRGDIMNIVLLSGSTVGSKTRIAMDDLKNELEVINEGHQIALMDLRDLEL
ncbi:predicted protein [Staphylococcus aureus subsp. aureus EMRSA16]|nr:predicted protein [Staphylococcus aureus subsp. aureus EMRSA16]